jgi:hypothetical protein
MAITHFAEHVNLLQMQVIMEMGNGHYNSIFILYTAPLLFSLLKVFANNLNGRAF